MALLKTIVSRFGAEATYWRIGEININRGSDTSLIYLQGYVSREARLGGSECVDSRMLQLTVQEMANLLNNKENVIIALYDYIKTTAEFSDATDSYQ